MNASQKQEAYRLASDLLANGRLLTDMVYIIYYPDNSVQADTGISGLSDPITDDEYMLLETPLKYVSLASLLAYGLSKT